MTVEQVWEASSESDTTSFFLWGALLGAGSLSKGTREAVEALDLFVGRYLLLATVAYVGLKFVHFKIFDPIPYF